MTIYTVSALGIDELLRSRYIIKRERGVRLLYLLEAYSGWPSPSSVAAMVLAFRHAVKIPVSKLEPNQQLATPQLFTFDELDEIAMIGGPADAALILQDFVAGGCTDYSLETLGLPPAFFKDLEQTDGDATDFFKKLASCFRRRALELHPDKVTDPAAKLAAAVEFKKLTEAKNNVKNVLTNIVAPYVEPLATVNAKIAKIESLEVETKMGKHVIIQPIDQVSKVKSICIKKTVTVKHIACAQYDKFISCADYVKHYSTQNPSNNANNGAKRHRDVFGSSRGDRKDKMKKTAKGGGGGGTCSGGDASDSDGECVSDGNSDSDDSNSCHSSDSYSCHTDTDDYDTESDDGNQITEITDIAKTTTPMLKIVGQQIYFLSPFQDAMDYKMTSTAIIDTQYVAYIMVQMENGQELTFDFSLPGIKSVSAILKYTAAESSLEPHPSGRRARARAAPVEPIKAATLKNELMAQVKRPTVPATLRELLSILKSDEPQPDSVPLAPRISVNVDIDLGRLRSKAFDFDNVSPRYLLQCILAIELYDIELYGKVIKCSMTHVGIDFCENDYKNALLASICPS